MVRVYYRCETSCPHEFAVKAANQKLVKRCVVKIQYSRIPSWKKKLNFSIRVNFDRLLSYFFATSLILRKNEDSKKVDDRLGIFGKKIVVLLENRWSTNYKNFPLFTNSQSFSKLLIFEIFYCFVIAEFDEF